MSTRGIPNFMALSMPYSALRAQHLTPSPVPHRVEGRVYAFFI